MDKRPGSEKDGTDCGILEMYVTETTIAFWIVVATLGSVLIWHSHSHSTIPWFNVRDTCMLLLTPHRILSITVI